ERHACEAMKLERGVQRDDERGRDSQDDVVIEPVFCRALPRKPRPTFAQRVQEDDQEHGQPEEAKFDANTAAGLEQDVLGRKRPLSRVQGVVIKSVNEDARDQGGGNEISEKDSSAVSALGIFPDGDRGCDGCVSAHLLATCSSVLTENFLYWLNRCKLRQCWRGVSTSTVACSGNQ